MSRLNIHVLARSQWVPAKPEDVFRFFEDAHNLSRITPPAMGFRIITPLPITMRQGTLIDYIVRIARFPMRWTTYIASYAPPRSFVDVQLKGPYAYWHHHHEFEAVDDGTRIADTVHYALPAGVLGSFVHALFVRRTLERIFNHRQTVIAGLFPGRQEGGSQ